MKKYIINSFSCLLTAILVLTMSLTGFAATEKTADKSSTTSNSSSKQNVYNLDNSLTAKELADAEALIDELCTTTGFNCAVVITKDIDGKTPMEFADDYYDKLFGKNTDGILLLLNNDTLKDWISTSGTAIRYYTDSRIQKMIDSITPNLQNNNYYKAIEAFHNKAKSFYSQGIPSDQHNVDEDGNVDYYDSTDKGFSLALLFPSLPIGIVAAVIVVISVKCSYKNKKKPTASQYLPKENVDFYANNDKFIREYTTSHQVSSSDSSGGGHGGSSTHTSSSGGSHGGGGRSR